MKFVALGFCAAITCTTPPVLAREAPHEGPHSKNKAWGDVGMPGRTQHRACAHPRGSPRLQMRTATYVLKAAASRSRWSIRPNTNGSPCINYAAKRNFCYEMFLQSHLW